MHQSNTARYINFAAFAALADAARSKEFSEHGVQDMVQNDPELTAAIEAIEAESRAVAVRSAAEGIVALKDDANLTIASLVSQLRTIRQQERLVLASIAKVNKAREFAAATRNYLPLITLVARCDIPVEYRDLVTALDAWEPEKDLTKAKPEVRAAAKAAKATK